MKVIIAGGRDLWVSGSELHAIIEASGFDVTAIVSGGARGIDQCGEAYALGQNKGLRRFPAQWHKHGNRAGPVRNAEMAAFADALILIWDGRSRGSASMRLEAEKRRLPIYEHIIDSTITTKIGEDEGMAKTKAELEKQLDEAIKAYVIAQADEIAGGRTGSMKGASTQQLRMAVTNAALYVANTKAEIDELKS